MSPVRVVALLGLLALPVACREDAPPSAARPSSPESPTPAPAAPTEDRDIALAKQLGEQVARGVVALLDSGDYGSAWDNGAGAFRASMPRTSWADALAITRAPLGERVSLELRGVVFTTEAPAAATGRYVIATFASSFSKRERAEEIVTVQEDAPGLWRLAGYRIQ